MAVATNSSVMVVRYQWILESKETGSKIMSSKMILFRGEEIFRVALKCEGERQTLIFMAIKLNKLGMKVQQVFYSKNPENSMESLIEDKNNGVNLQVFFVPFNSKVFEKTTFTFEIQINGTVADFSFQLADQLLKNQLWMAVKKCQWTDIDLIVQGKTISAHKCVLAARSPVFATKFDKDRLMKQIVIDDVDFSSVEQFLYFLYTGEANKSFDNEQLFILAKRYQLVTLVSLCKNALVQIDAEELTRLLISLNPNNDSIASFEIRPMKDTELYFDPNTSTFLADWDLLMIDHQGQVGPVFFGPKFQQEKLFSVHYAKKSSCRSELRLFCTKSRNSGYQVVEAFCSFNKKGQFPWVKMERSNVQERGLIVIFSTTLNWKISLPLTISFRIKITSIIANYHHEMIDTTCATQLWTAVTKQQLTDVEISLGSHKFEAHRVVLAARSTVFDTKLNENQTIAKSLITVSETDPDIFQHFLRFLYTGTLEIPACNKQLLALAETYKVETLKNLCQSANQELDVEEVTTSILAANCPLVVDS